MSKMVHLYSFDQGLLTVWCHLSVHINDNKGEVGCFQCGEADHVGIGNMLYDNQALRSAAAKKEIEIAFVVERFIMNTKISPQPWSLETIGLIRYFAAINQ